MSSYKPYKQGMDGHPVHKENNTSYTGAAVQVPLSQTKKMRNNVELKRCRIMDEQSGILKCIPGIQQGIWV